MARTIVNRRIIALALCAVAAPVAVGAGDWPHVRGPSYDGRAAFGAAAESWPTREVWRRSTGDGYSGIVIHGGRAYTQIQTLAGQHVVCFELHSGQELWRTRYELPWEPDGEWPGPYAAPTYADGRIYFAGCLGRVGCLNAQNGRVIWSVDLVRDLGVKLPDFGYAATPLVFDDTVFLPTADEHGSVVALDARSGRLVWRAGEGAGSYSSAIVAHGSGHPQIVVLLENVVVGLDPRSGRELWSRKLWSGFNMHGSWPIYEEPYLLCSLPFRQGAQGFRLDRRGTVATADSVWSNAALCVDILGGACVSGRVYACDVRSAMTSKSGLTPASLKCVDLRSGREMWSSSEPGHCSVVAWGNRLVMLNETGALVFAEAGPDGYAERGRYPLFPGRPCWTPPAIADGFLVARSHGEIACLALTDAAARSVVSVGTPPHRSWWSLCAPTLQRHLGVCFWAPSLRDQLWWYAFCLAGVFLPAYLLARWGFRRGVLRNGIRHGLSLGLSAAGLWLFSGLGPAFVFTWPAIPFLALAILLDHRDRIRAAGPHSRPLAMRLGLAAFVIAVVAYWRLCEAFYLVCGWGYLVGLAPAVLVLLGAARRARQERRGDAGMWVEIAAFTVYFWSAALFVTWRTRG